ncbi:MAG: hypothetical protein HOV83_10285 [Catenulispora sp.]|nr:hypothetical protein [Catenulispora sp.]
MIRISTKYFWLAFMFAFFKPWLIIDGQQVRLNWGDNDIPAAPGVHQLTIWVPYLWKVGQATFTIDTTAAGSAQVYYAAPAFAFGSGAVGVTPQEPPNKTLALIIQLGLPALIIVCCCGSIFLSALTSNSSNY